MAGARALRYSYGTPSLHLTKFSGRWEQDGMGQVPSVDAIKQVALVDVPAVNLAKLEVKPLFSAVGYKSCPVKLTKTSGRHPKTGKS